MKNAVYYSDLLLLTKGILSNVHTLVEYGADGVELLMDGPLWDKMENVSHDLAIELQGLPFKYTIHPPAWDINLTSENKVIREGSFKEYVRAIHFASKIGAKHVVIHPGFSAPVFNKRTAHGRAKEAIQRLCEIAKPFGVKLAIENVGYNGSSIFTQEEFTLFLDDVENTASYLIDTGHAHLDHWDLPRLIEEIKDRIIAFHLHDNHGTADDHLPLGEGTIRWEKVLTAIDDHASNAELILEYAPNTPIEKLVEGKKLLHQGKVFI